MKRYDLIVVGAGPAGLSASIEAARKGMTVGVFDENALPGGQLFKQIHKFFGAKEHKAKIRGFNIGNELLDQAKDLNVDVHLNAIVTGIFRPLQIKVVEDESTTSYSAESILVATGASENVIPFDGWTLPGVIGAGAAQTMMNLHGVKPGKKVLMVGSGNVGLVVSFQLMQAGCEVVGIIDAAPRVGGYGVHASKVSRTGVPFYMSHSIIKADGIDRVESVTIAEVDSKWQAIEGTEKVLDVDTICLAVGLSPMSKLTQLINCDMKDEGIIESSPYGETSIEGILVAGDVKGIEEASSAMIGGRIAALTAAKRSGYIQEAQFQLEYQALRESLDQLHGGLFAPENKGNISMVDTDEGIKLSQTLFKEGYISEKEISRFPGAIKGRRKGPYPLIECTQNIPCNPCQDACKFGCISVGDEITSLPTINQEVDCKNCGLCVALCPGQAIFLIDDDYAMNEASVTLPYEFLPLPQVGDKGNGLDRSGRVVCRTEVVAVRDLKAFDHTPLVTIKVPKDQSMAVRFYKHMQGEI